MTFGRPQALALSLALLALGAPQRAWAAPGGPPLADAAAEAFWERDLHRLVTLLASPPRPGEVAAHALWSDVVRLLQCEPLPALGADGAPVKGKDKAPDPALDAVQGARLLLRLEAARHARLGAAAATAPTLWRDVRAADFFRRTPARPLPEPTVRWPVEEEAWEGERLHVTLRSARCQGAAPGAGDELALLSPDALGRLEAALAQDPDALVRVRYLRASRLLRHGLEAEARAAAGPLSGPAAGPLLGGHVKLLRLELGLDPAEGYAALVAEPSLAPLRPAVLARAAAAAEARGAHAEVLALPLPPAPPDGDAGWRGLAYREQVLRRALAARALGDEAALRAELARAFPAWGGLTTEPAVAGLRELALDVLGRADLGQDPGADALLAALAPTPQDRAPLLQQAGGRALARARVAGAEAAARQLVVDPDPRVQARGRALQAETAFALGDRARLQAAVGALLGVRAAPRTTSRQRDDVDTVVLQLAQALVAASAERTDAAWTAALQAELARMQEQLPTRHARTFAPLQAALVDRPMAPAPAAEPAPAPGKGRRAAPRAPRAPTEFVAVGEVAVGLPGARTEAPRLALPWPEPYSLLSLPQPGGTPADWFSSRIPFPPDAAAPPPAAVRPRPDTVEVKHVP